jgi:hypothetical protein
MMSPRQNHEANRRLNLVLNFWAQTPCSRKVGQSLRMKPRTVEQIVRRAARNMDRRALQSVPAFKASPQLMNELHREADRYGTNRAGLIEALVKRAFDDNKMGLRLLLGEVDEGR